MKKILLALLILGITVFIVSSQTQGFFADNDLFSRSVCDKPIKYKIGIVDSRFKLSEEEVRAGLSRAENIWEAPSGRNLFEYDSNSALRIDFVYDHKQALNTQINQLESELVAGRGDLDSKKAAYDKAVSEFNKQVEQFNSDIEHWNKQGGAPPDEYAKLKQRQSDLEAQAQKLSEEAKNLNLNAKDYNLNVGKLNAQISEFNADLKRRPEEGLFDPQNNIIYIYFVPSQAELEHTLAHEMGHALGLEHTLNDPEAIMYPYSSESIKASANDITGVHDLCAPKSLPDAIFTNASYIFQKNFLNETN